MSVVVDNSVVEFDLTWADEGFGEADLRMLESDRWWPPKVGRPLDGAWWDDQPATATILCHAETVSNCRVTISECCTRAQLLPGILPAKPMPNRCQP